MNDERLYEAKRDAAKTVYKFMHKYPNAVIFDTETTGLDANLSRMVSFAAITLQGEVLLDTLINPEQIISDDATEIHGITNQMVRNAPTYNEVAPLIHAAIHRRPWLVYNLSFDVSFVREMAHKSKVKVSPASIYIHADACFAYEALDYREIEIQMCVMETYATWWGAYSDKHDSFTWQKLTTACKRHKIEVDAPAHSALGDCFRTLELCRYLANWYTQIEWITQ